MFSKIKKTFHEKVIGQSQVLEGMMIALLCDGHILLEGVPGLAKTLAVKTFSEILGLDFKRIQFTPDLLPADIIGIEIYNPQKSKFLIKKGPLFGNIILADEINRAPSKVQSALLEAMQEYQVTIGEESFLLKKPYLILATQNPIEQEGTYQLPEAQIDRFMIKVNIDYPNEKEELEIIKNQTSSKPVSTKPLLKISDIDNLKKALSNVHIEEIILEYIVKIVLATRSLDSIGMDKNLISNGVSPRGSIYLTKAAQAHAFLQGREYVTPDDVKEMAYITIAHRILLSYEAEASNITQKKIIEEILEKIPVP